MQIDKAILLEDIKSYKKINNKDLIYGIKGDIIKIIAKHGDIYIVEGKERFSVDKLKLKIID